MLNFCRVPGPGRCLISGNLRYLINLAPMVQAGYVPSYLTTSTSSLQLLGAYQVPPPLDTGFRNEHHKLYTKCHMALKETNKGR